MRYKQVGGSARRPKGRKKAMYFCHLKFDSSDGLAVRNSEVGCQCWVANNRCKGVTVLMREPVAVKVLNLQNIEKDRRHLLFGQIGMACSEFYRQLRITYTAPACIPVPV